MKRFALPLAALAMCLNAQGLSVESGNLAAEFLSTDMTLAYGPQTVIESLSFYLADEAWKPVFPEGAAYDVTQSGTVVTKATKPNPSVKVEEVYTITADGLRVDLTAEILPQSGAHYAVCDLFLNKPMFANAQVRREGQATLVLDPVQWTQLEASQLILATPLGDWHFAFTSSGPAQWVLRSVCDRSWGAEERKTFTFLNQAVGIPAAGLTQRLSIEAKFVPKAGSLQDIERLFSEASSSYLTALLARYGSPVAAAALPAEPAARVAWLAARVASAAADLDESRLEPAAGTIIPAPKTYQRGTGVFAVPAELAVTSTATHAAAIEVLAEDLARFGVQTRRREPGGEPAAPVVVLLGVPARDEAVRQACERLGVRVDATTPGPEGYALVVTPETVLIAGSDDAGVLYGAQSLRQLLRKGAAGAEIPVVTITDHPDLSFRGFYVEGAGQVANSDTLRRLIRNTYSYFKANAVVLEVRWSEFKWATHPELAGERALALEELAAISAYARRFHLEVIPAVFTYGKVGDLFATHPEIAEVPPGPERRRTDTAYCPNQPATYALVFDLLSEVVSATQCRRLHIGHDEIEGMARCPACQAVAPAELFAKDVNTIADWLAQRQVETMIWGDFLLDNARWTPLGVDAANSGNPAYGGHAVHPAIDHLRKQVIIADWHYADVTRYPSLAYFAEKGFRVIGCPWHKTRNNYSLAQDVHAIQQLGVLVTDWGFLATRSPGANSVVGVACAWDTAMPEPERLPWSPEAVLAASIQRRDRPSRAAAARCQPVSLGPAAKRPLAGATEAWFGASARHALIAPPTGPVRLFGVDYQIGTNCVVVGNAAGGADFPAGSAPIPVGQAARSLVFLQALSVDEPAVGRRTYGHYRVTYASGQVAEIAIDTGNSTHWLSRTPRLSPWMPWIYGYTWDATLAWEGCTASGEPVNLQAYEWPNPRPDDPFASVELLAQRDVPGLKLALVALTAVR
jgi:hypothetical protein